MRSSGAKAPNILSPFLSGLKARPTGQSPRRACRSVGDPEGSPRRAFLVCLDGSSEHEAASSAGVPLGLDQVAAALEALSAELRESGIIGLRIAPGLSTFERSLKHHVAEYLAKYD